MDQKTIQTYNTMAKEYDEETIVFWDIFPRGFFDRFISLVSGHVLDVGCGPNQKPGQGFISSHCESERWNTR